MRATPVTANVTRQAFTALSLALMVISIWNGPACAVICANEQATAQRPTGCHEGHRAERRGTGTADQACPKEICARIQPASQTSRPAEVAAPEHAAMFAFFPVTPSGADSDLSRFCGRASLLYRGLGPPIPPSLFTVLRT